MTMSLTVTSTKISAASGSAADVIAALNTHFGSSSQFNAILPTPTTDHTIYIEPAGSEPWRFALSTIGASTNYLAGSMEPDKATAPSGLDPSTSATAAWSGVASRGGGIFGRHMMIHEITGLGRDAVTISFYSDSSGSPAYPYGQTTHFGRIWSPKVSDVPGLDGLGFLSGLGKWVTGSGAQTSSPHLNSIIAVCITVGINASKSRVRIGPTAWSFNRWWLTGNRAATTNNLLAARRVLEPIDCGANDDTAVTAASHTACGMFLVANHMVLWHDNLVAGAKVEDTVNNRSFVAASDATTTTAGNQILWRCAPGFNPAP
jgi:hypothetical protein